MLSIVPYNPKFLVVPENIVESCVDAIGDGDNQFKILFESAKMYKSANMTPIYLLDRKSMIMYVAAEETYGKSLN